MKQLNDYHSFIGMQRDIAVSKHPANMLYDARNIRIVSDKEGSSLVITNIKGHENKNISITGTYLGHCLLNNFLVVFSYNEENNNYITRIDLSSLNDGATILNIGENDTLLYLKFPTTPIIEAVGSYENEDIQKVYWVDGVNQPRVINIAPSNDSKIGHYNVNSFDFVPTIESFGEIQVKPVLGAGMFPAGVIQYAFTYYNKYGQESNIFYVTPLLYTSFKDRAGSPEEKIAISFHINLKYLDTNFDYVRIYSIMRTSLNATPIVKRIQDIQVPSDTNTEVNYIDTGTSGESVDPMELLYIGGEEITAKTIEQKDGTLFFGGINITRNYGNYSHAEVQKILLKYTGLLDVDDEEPTRYFPQINTENFKNAAEKRNYCVASTAPITQFNTLLPSPKDESLPEDKYYNPPASFKKDEYYRLGLQFQYKNGKWSEPFWVGDSQNTVQPFIVGNYTLPIFTLSFDSEETTDLLESMKGAGYRRVRPLLAVPTEADRTILCQGIGCPTLYRYAERYKEGHHPIQGDDESKEHYNLRVATYDGPIAAQSSWLFRTMVLDDAMPKSSIDPPGTYVNDYHVPGLDTDSDVYTENAAGYVTCKGRVVSQYDIEYGEEYGEEGNTWIWSPYILSTEVMGDFDDNHTFRIARNIATLHTPELIFDESSYNMDYADCSVYSVGGYKVLTTFGDIDIQTSTPQISQAGGGYQHKMIKTDGNAALISGFFYDDYIVDDNTDDGQDIMPYFPYSNEIKSIKWPVYMWHKSGSINNDVVRPNRSAELLKKRISNYRYAGDSGDSVTINDTAFDLQAKDIKLFSGEELSVVKVDGNTYMGNIETMLIPRPSCFYMSGNMYKKSTSVWKYGDDGVDYTNRVNLKLTTTNPLAAADVAGTKTLVFDADNLSSDPPSDPWANVPGSGEVGNKTKNLGTWREGISMKYKSTPHLVFKTGGRDLFQISAGSVDVPAEYLDDSTFPILEVRRPYDKDTLYGGTSDDALREITWIPCGEPVSISYLLAENDNCLTYRWGDTFFQRFECLKTYAFTKEDKNQVVEIGSCMLESRVNMDGRYDKNRGQISNLNMSPQNFNLHNPVYNQMNNFFSYKILDDKAYDITSFPNEITWSKMKKPGADVDLWTNTTLASTLDLDGSKGKITSLKTLDDRILCFQEKALSQVMFNSRVQIPTSDGVPVEITNNYKVDGYKIITDGVGCKEQSAICKTPVGIYFIDSISGHLFNYNSTLTDLSLKCNMASWFNTNYNTTNKVLYDDVNHDVYVVKNWIFGELIVGDAICYSEVLNQFTSFVDYQYINLIESYSNKIFSLNEELKIESSGVKTSNKLYQMYEGVYNSLFPRNNGQFNAIKPWYITFISNGIGDNAIDLDKTFTNIDYRMDVYTDVLSEADTFKTIQVKNEYQDTGEVTLHGYNSSDLKSKHLNNGNLQKKFRTWRIQIPRDSGSRNRIRNQWCKIKLTYKVPELTADSRRAILHDLSVQYYV